MLTEKEELDLIAKAQAGDSRAEAALIKAFAPLVKKAASRWRGRGEEDDLIAAGNIGLLIAIRKFDPERGNRLATVASHWVLNEIAEASRKDNVINLGSSRLGRAITHGSARVRRVFGIAPGATALTDEQAAAVASAFGTIPETVRSAFALQRVVSLDMPVSATREGAVTTLADKVADEDAVDPVEVMDEATRLEIFREALATLPDRERAIVEARHLSPHAAHTLEDLSVVYGVSRERIRQLETRGLERIKEAFQWIVSTREDRKIILRAA